MISSKPGKQRKRLARLHAHDRRRSLAANLSNDLAQRHGVGSLPVRSGDTVRIVRGDFVGLEGKVETVDYSSGRVYVEGMTREKAAGVASKLPVHVSKVLLTNLNLSDKWRSGVLSEKSKQGK